MAISSSIFSTLTAPGFVTPILAIDLAVMMTGVYLLKNLVSPIVASYKHAKMMDNLTKPTKRHCFFGHLKEYPPNETGLLRGARIKTKNNPTMFNNWFAPFLSAMQTYHPDSAVPLLASGAPKDDIFYRFLRPWIGDGLLTSNGKKWQRNRHLLTPAFHFSVLKGYTEVFNECSKVMLDKWEKTLEIPIEVTGDVSLMTLDTMLKCAMSSETNCQQTRTKHPYIQAVDDLKELTVYRITHPYLHSDFVFWKTKYGRRFKEAADIVHHHAEQIVQERRRQLLSTQTSSSDSKTRKEQATDFSYGGKHHLDFLDILLQTRDEDGNGLNEREIRDEVDTFLVEGHDTTASATSWALYNLAKYPEFQETCRKEVEDVLSEKPHVEWNDYSKLSFLTMFIKESMRLYPTVVSLGRELEHDMTVRSKLNKQYLSVISRGSHVGLHIFNLHRNELVWDKPEKFDPERFTKESISKRSPHAYLPFSAGSRNCIGQNFAMNEMKTVLAQTLRRYRLCLDEETPEPIMHPRLTLQSQNGVYLKLQRL